MPCEKISELKIIQKSFFEIPCQSQLSTGRKIFIKLFLTHRFLLVMNLLFSFQQNSGGLTND